MNRREFLRLGTAAVAAIALPAIALDVAKDKQTWVEGVNFERWDNIRFIESPSNDWHLFEPQHKYGNGMHITAMPSPKVTETLIETLYENMVKTVPPGFREQVEIYGPIAVDFGRAATISWMYTPA